MSLRTYPGRLLFVTAAWSLLLLVSSVAVAAYLTTQQARTAEELGENIGSRRAAAHLEERLTDLIALHNRGATDVEPLHERVHDAITEIDQYADKEAERELARRVSESFEAYLAAWRAHPDGHAAARYLEQDTLRACQRLRDFNAVQIEQSERDHRETLRWMAWGFAAVGVLGSVAGLLLGYGLARGLRRAVDSLLVRVQGASDLLGQGLATVRVEQNGQPLDRIDDLVRQVEQAVDRIQQREREVRRAERLAALGQLAAGVAHEIRNPLTSVQLLVQTARSDPAVGGLTDDDLALIDDELGRIERSLRTFLDYARPPKLERTSCVLSNVARDALSLVHPRAAQQGVQVRFSPTAAPVTLDADPGQLRQVILNLCLNSLDAMPVGGTLDVAAARADGDWVELAVADTGPGIAPEILPRLFEPFATGKETGLGLGLVVSKRIVEEHGGTIEGFNRPGGGACFRFRLPGK